VVSAIPLALIMGIAAGVRRDHPFDHVSGTLALVAAAVPEFVIAIVLILLFASVVLRVLPPVSLVPPGASPLSDPSILVLPVATLAIAVIPYVMRMVRASMIEAMQSEYVEMARLKGMPGHRVVLRHALPNALPTTVQAIGLTLAYLAGGVVVVEYVFGYPGIGQALISAVNARDVPVIQFVVIVLAAFYIVVNIAADVTSLLLSPKARTR
jgi:peptide/nickel transport system permease protein